MEWLHIRVRWQRGQWLPQEFAGRVGCWHSNSPRQRRCFGASIFQFHMTRQQSNTCNSGCYEGNIHFLMGKINDDPNRN
jgi:hypothetical protein